MNGTMESKVFQVRPNSTSLRGTIPQSVSNSLKLTHGDTIKWSIKVGDNKIIAIVEKAEQYMPELLSKFYSVT